MKVRVRLFASYAQLAGWRDQEMEVREGACAKDVLDQLRRGSLMVLPGTGRPLLAVNREHVLPDHPLREGDEVGVFPPVSGGSTDDDPFLSLTASELDPRALADLVRAPGHGAVLVFEGTVRDRSEGPVRAITYEAYEDMALSVMARIRREVEERHPPARIAIAHRTGRLEVGVTSVIVAAGAPHRRQAFAACRLAMDRVKESLPVWKLEEADSGKTRWR